MTVQQKVMFKHEYWEDGDVLKHRIYVVEHAVGVAKVTVHGQWTTYRGVAMLKYERMELRACTAYYEGTFPVDKVFRVAVMEDTADADAMRRTWLGLEG